MANQPEGKGVDAYTSLDRSEDRHREVVLGSRSAEGGVFDERADVKRLIPCHKPYRACSNDSAYSEYKEQRIKAD